MNVKDLIEQLKQLPADAPVMVQGYEGGYDDIVRVEERPVIKKPDAPNWDGEYDDAEKNDKNALSSVVVLGKRRQTGIRA